MKCLYDVVLLAKPADTKYRLCQSHNQSP